MIDNREENLVTLLRNSAGCRTPDLARTVLAWVDEHYYPRRANPDRVDEWKAARAVGLTTDRLREHSIRLWGQSFVAERDARIDAMKVGNRRSLQAHRGHVSRTLYAELRALPGPVCA